MSLPTVPPVDNPPLDLLDALEHIERLMLCLLRNGDTLGPLLAAEVSAAAERLSRSMIAALTSPTGKLFHDDVIPWVAKWLQEGGLTAEKLATHEGRFRAWASAGSHASWIRARLSAIPAEAVTKQDPPVDPSEESADQKESRPKAWLFGVKDIVAAVGKKSDDWRVIKSLNEKFAGPITNSGQGTQPLVEREALIDWWNKLDILAADLDNRRTGAKLSVEQQYDYARDGKVVPEIGGGVKKRRSDSRT